jgi:hypothetical protein
MNRLLTLLSRKSYRSKVLAIPGLLAYWPLNETAGVVAADVSGNARHGAYSGVTLGQPGIGDGNTCPLFDGAAGYVNVYSASLAGAFNGAEGSLVAWAQVAAAGVWTDSTLRSIVTLETDTNNKVTIEKSATNNRLNFTHIAGGTTKQQNTTAYPLTTWLTLGITWSKSGDALIGYVNGTATATVTGVGDYTGALAAVRCNIGARLTTPTQLWSGWLAHVAVWGRVLTATEMGLLGRLP